MQTKAKYTEEQHRENVLRSAENNHIWINGFSLIRPTEELEQSIGREVIRMLKDRDCTIPSSLCATLDMDPSLHRELVLRVNAS
jgi:hypothetical protein